jgi:hypothetical protein
MLASEMLLLSFLFGFQSMRAGEPSSRDQAPSSADAFVFKVSSPLRRCCQCAEYSSRISDLESRLSLAKRQAQMSMDKASRACRMLKQISVLEDKVSDLVARITHFEECESFLLGIIESVCEMLLCKSSGSLPPFFVFALRIDFSLNRRYLP